MGHGDIRRMTPTEFRDLGYLQEVNRLVLHPAGLALEVVVGTDGFARFGEIWDYRDDPTGIIFESVDPEKAASVAEEQVRHTPGRARRLLTPPWGVLDGPVIQPVPDPT